MNDDQSDEPPDEMNGSGFPVVGRMPVAQAMFRNAWNTSMTVRLDAMRRPNSSGAPSAILKPAYRNARNSTMTAKAPMKPSSSPMIE